jgi:GNAT superfamily N-acetyltransferase
MTRIESIDDPDASLREAVNAELRRHNELANPIWWARSGDAANAELQLNLFALDADGTVLGGLFGSTSFSWLKISITATRRDRRLQGIGRALISRAEAIGRERGCKYAYVDTMDYQAPEFYLKAGYRVAGTLNDWDSHGHNKLLLVKDL